MAIFPISAIIRLTMWQRRIIPGIFCLCFLFLFGEKILLSGIGESAKLYLRFKKGWMFDYSSIQWKNWQIVLSDISLEQEGFFSLNAEEASLFFQEKHFAMVRPKLKMWQIPPSDAKPPPAWTCSIKGGSIDGLGMSNASFSYEKDSFETFGVFHLGQNGSSVSIEMHPRDQGMAVSLAFDHTPLSLLKHWIGESFSGDLHGTIDLVKEKKTWTASEGQLEVSGFSQEGFCKNVNGKIDWDGWIQWSGSTLDWKPMFEKGRFRLFLQSESFYAEDLTWNDTCLSCSFDGKAGLKWEFSACVNGQAAKGSGRGFFHSLKEHWIESEIYFGSGDLVIKGEAKKDGNLWNIFAHSLDAKAISVLQQGAKFFKIPTPPWHLEEGMIDLSAQIFTGKNGTWNGQIFDAFVKNLQVKGDLFSASCEKAVLKEGVYSFQNASVSTAGGLRFADGSGNGDLSTGTGFYSGKWGDFNASCDLQGNWDLFQGNVKIQGPVDAEAFVKIEREGFLFRFALEQGKALLATHLRLEDVSMEGEATLEGFSCYNAKGVLDTGQKVSFYCPIFQSEGAFDLRLEKDFIDLARFTGDIKKGEIVFDPLRTHLLGSCVRFAKANLFSKVSVLSAIPCKLISYFIKMPPFLEERLSGSIDFSYVYEKSLSVELDLAAKLSIDEGEVDLCLHLQKQDAVWHLKPSLIGDFTIVGTIEKGESYLLQGRATHGKTEADFSGKFLSFDDWGIKLSHCILDSKDIKPLNRYGADFLLEGDGMIHSKSALEADFDFTAKHAKIGKWSLENKGPLHLYFSSAKGISLRGLNGSILKEGDATAFADGKIGLFQYDLNQSLFTFTQSQLHLEPKLIDLWERGKFFSFAQSFIPQEAIYLEADIATSLDLSRLSFSMKEAKIPILQNVFAVQNFHFDRVDGGWNVNFDWDHQGELIPMDLFLQLEPRVFGKLTIENGMKIDWSLDERLVIHSIDGKCLGMDASFRRERDFLIGSVDFDCNRLKNIVPPEIVRVFNELKMGDGYELIGKIFTNDGISFQGILSGKQIDLFGFQLKNLMARIDIAKDHTHIFDVKISDLAGTMKIDQIIAEGNPDRPWTISIPHITITDLRPSLLQKIGSPPEEPNPLLVRELKIDDFQGLLEDSKTYTAKGELRFINSYKREKSILELPSNVLSRIVGLDLELLIPVCGELKYELRNGLFHLTELQGAFSENKRSEFFLVFSEESPVMDLDWNLNILIQMKQFVLLKFTEAFVISITGKLDEPKFQLQNKKRFQSYL